MTERCHRCDAELPRVVSDAGYREPEALLFCPHCGAPQIRLPEQVQVRPLTLDAESSTGRLPPPNPRAVDWPVALQVAALVALGGAVLAGIGAVSAAASLLGAVWVMACGVTAIALYTRRRPRAWMDRKTGQRIGFVTGLLTVCALAVAGAGEGVTKRFVLKNMAGADHEYTQQMQQMHGWFAQALKDQGQSPEVQKTYMDTMNSAEMNGPEMRAGLTLVGVAMQGALLLLLATGSGALTGALRSRGRELAAGRETP